MKHAGRVLAAGECIETACGRTVSIRHFVTTRPTAAVSPPNVTLPQWRRECRLLKSKGKFYSSADGFHPAGAVIDEKRGVQHILIYSGHPNGPAGAVPVNPAP